VTNENQSPQSTRLCTYCNQEKTWLWTGDKLKDGSKIYVDDNGSRWAGRRCPECERCRVQEASNYDTFDRDLIFKRLEAEGYQVVSKKVPIKIEKDGQVLTVTPKRATADGAKIILESPLQPNEETDMVALIFETVRLVPRSYLHPMEQEPATPPCDKAIQEDLQHPAEPAQNTSGTL